MLPQMIHCARLVLISLFIPFLIDCNHPTVHEPWHIFVTTYNTGGKLPTAQQFSEWFKLHESHSPYDLVVVGLQETTEMKLESFKYFLQPAKEKTITKTWTDDIARALNQMAKKEEDKYALHSSHEMVAIFLAVFVRKGREHLISQFHSDHVETGIMDIVGNKGGVGISMTIDHSLHLVFVNSHITHGPTKEARKVRNQNYHKILKELDFRRKNEEGTNPKRIEDHHVIFWMGDLNYRLTKNHDGFDYDTVIKDFNDPHTNVIRRYLPFDELQEEKRERRIFVGFYEGAINFKATYKFGLKTSHYDGGSEKRIPAWCDRVLFKTESNSCNVELKQKTYGSVPAVDVSDHKPVYASFELVKSTVHNEGTGRCLKGKVIPLMLPKKPSLKRSHRL